MQNYINGSAIKINKDSLYYKMIVMTFQFPSNQLVYGISITADFRIMKKHESMQSRLENISAEDMASRNLHVVM